MKIIALDLGSTCGFASGINEKITKHDYKDFGKMSNEGMAAFFNWIHPIVGKVDIVVCERPHSHYNGYHPLRVLFGMFGIVQAVCGGWGKSLIPIGSTEVKKFWTDYGHANKTLMLQKAAERGFTSVKDHNECDAVALYTYHWEVLRAKPLEQVDEQN